MKRQLTLQVNGRAQRVEARRPPYAARGAARELRLVGAREGCGVGMCGACTVLARRPADQLLPAARAREVRGRAVETVEGLESNGDRLHADPAGLRRPAPPSSAPFCTPGMILATKALLAENPNPSDEEITRVPGRQPVPLRQLQEDRGRREGGGRAAPPGDAGRAAATAEDAGTDEGPRSRIGARATGERRSGRPRAGTAAAVRQSTRRAV